MPQQSKELDQAHNSRVEKILLDIVQFIMLASFVVALLMNKAMGGAIAFGVGIFFSYFYLKHHLKYRFLVLLILIGFIALIYFALPYIQRYD